MRSLRHRDSEPIPSFPCPFGSSTSTSASIRRLLDLVLRQYAGLQTFAASPNPPRGSCARDVARLRARRAPVLLRLRLETADMATLQRRSSAFLLFNASKRRNLSGGRGQLTAFHAASAVRTTAFGEIQATPSRAPVSDLRQLPLSPFGDTVFSPNSFRTPAPRHTLCCDAAYSVTTGRVFPILPSMSPGRSSSLIWPCAACRAHPRHPTLRYSNPPRRCARDARFSSGIANFCANSFDLDSGIVQGLSPVCFASQSTRSFCG